jgi:hemerythrin superfamily protein
MNIAPVRNEEPLMPADPFTLLQSDHRQVEALLKSLADSEQRAARERLVQQLTLAFDTHARFEEQAVYPHVIRVMDTATETEAEVEHALARDGLRKLAELVDAPGFGAAVEMLRAGITHHVKEEESEIFPALRSGLDEEVKSQLVSQLRDARLAAGLPVVDPDTTTKDQLLRMAADANIDGRSSMTKEQLAQALSS